MYDFELNMRIWRGTMEAAFAYAEATIAGAAAFQSQIERGSEWASWSGSKGDVSANAFTFGQAPGVPPLFNPWAMTAALWQGFFRQTRPAWTTAWLPAMPVTPNDALSICFAWQPWPTAYAQQPIMFSMMALGMPFVVADPMSRATTSMLDASDAMRQQAAQVLSGKLPVTHHSDPDFWKYNRLN